MACLNLKEAISDKLMRYIWGSRVYDNMLDAGDGCLGYWEVVTLGVNVKLTVKTL